jgi:hypothetical protein
VICEFCKAAGAVKALNTDEDGTPALDELTPLVGKLHEQCPGGTRCDCQHRSGQVLRSASDGNR